MDFIVSYVRQEHVERIVVGQPKQANGEDSENMGRINSFVRRLHERLPEIPVEFSMNVILPCWLIRLCCREV